MKTIYLFFIHLVTGLWHSHHYHSIRKRHYISPSFKSSTSSSSSEVIPVVQSTNVLSTNRDLLIDDLRKSKVLYQFILTFSERARKELSFSLFVEHDFAAFLFGVLRFNRRVQWASLSNDLKSIIHQYVELEINDTSSAQVTRYIDILWCLGKLSIDFRTQPTSLQAVILNKLITFDSVSIGREISRILYSLSLMQLRWIDIPSQSRRTLLDLLTTYLPSMNVVEVVNSVYALGRMGCSWKTLPKPLYQELFVHVQRSVSMSGVISISNLLWGMSKSDVSWEELPTTLRLDILNKLVMLSPLPAQSLSSCLSSLHRLGASWSDFPSSMHRAVEESLPSLEGSSEQAVANVLWALGSLGTQLGHFDKAANILSCVDRSIRRVCPSFTAQGLSNCFLGLAKLGVQQQELSSQTWSALQQACWDQSRKSSLARMDPRAISNVVWSLGVMQTRWLATRSTKEDESNESDKTLMSANMSESLLVAIDRTLGTMTEQGLSMTLLGLAKMKVNADDLSSRTRQKIFNAIDGVSSNMTGQGISNCLWSLYGLGFTWRCDDNHDISLVVPVSVQQSLFAALVKEATHLPPPTVSLCLNSFAKLGCVYQDLPLSVSVLLEKSLESTCNQMTAREISNTIYGLGKMNRQFHHMSPQTQTALLRGLERTLPEMDEQEVGIAVWGVSGQMGLSFPQMPTELQSQICHHIVRLQPQLTCQSLTALFQGLSKVGDLQWHELPGSLRTALLEALESVLADDSQNSKINKNDDSAINSEVSLLWIEKLKLIGNVMYSAGRLQLSWENELKPETRTQVLVALARVNFRRESERLIAQQLEPVLHAVNGMAKLKLTWTQLNDDVRVVILDSLVVLAQIVLRLRSNSKSPTQYQHWANRWANLMWSLAQLNFQWKEDLLSYPTHVKYVLACAVQLFPYMSGYEFAWSLWSLAKWSVQFTDLPTPLQQTIIACAEKHVSRATSQELGVMLWAFIRIKAPISEFPPALTAQIIASMDMMATK